MHTSCRRWIIVLLIACLLQVGLSLHAMAEGVPSTDLRSASEVKNGMVRVLLSSMGYPTALDITLKGAFLADGIRDVELPNGAKVRVTMNTSTGELTLTYGTRQYNMGKTLVLRRRASNDNSGFRIAQAKKSANLYPGDLHLSARTSGAQWRLHPVAHVYIEYYLHGVLPYEMGDSAPMEALKAQAVAARTFTLKRMNSSSTFYDLTDTTSDQVYYGNSDNTTRCTQAVDVTKGIVLMVNNRLAETFYTASNGGQTESVANAWGSRGYTESIVKDDPFDLQNPDSVVYSRLIYQDNQHLSQNAALKALLNKKATAALGTSAVVRTISDISLHTPKYEAPSKLYTKMVFLVTADAGGVQHTLNITCDIFGELESLLGLSINSGSNELWSVQKEGNAYRVSARRYGHGIGMSQRGSMQMAKLGYAYDQILGFYYNETYRMQYTFSHTILPEVGNETITETEPPAGNTTPAPESTPAPQVIGYANVTTLSGSLNLRRAPESGSTVLLQIPRMTRLPVHESQNGWTRVTYNGQTGWVMTSFLTMIEQEVPDDGSSVNTYAVVTTVSGSLNLRESRDAHAKVLATIPRNATIPVLERQASWTKTTYAGATGWVMNAFLTFSDGGVTDDTITASTTATVIGGTLNLRASKSTASRSLAKIPEGTVVSVLEKSGDWVRTTYAGNAGWVMSKFLAFSESGDHVPEETTPAPSPENTPNASTGVRATVVEGKLNLRAAPDGSAAVLLRIPDGASVLVLQRGDVWSQVQYDGRIGYVMTRYLSFSDASIESTARVATQSGSLNLRETASSDARVLLQIPQGSQVTVLQRATGWCAVRYQGVNGFVMTKFLSFSGDGAANGDAAGETTQPALPTVTPSPSNDGTSAWINVNGTLNLRSNAQSGAAVIALLQNRCEATVLERGETWTRIRIASLTGYVQTQFLTWKKPAAEPEGTLSVVHAGGGLNLRYDARDGAKVILLIPDGATVRIMENMGAWCRVSYKGVTGYVKSDYLAGSVPSALSGNAIFDQTLNPPDKTLIAVVRSDLSSVNVRRWCSTDAPVDALLKAGSAATVVQLGDTWCELQLDQNTRGYCMREYLTLLPVE